MNQSQNALTFSAQNQESERESERDEGHHEKEKGYKISMVGEGKNMIGGLAVHETYFNTQETIPKTRGAILVFSCSARI